MSSSYDTICNALILSATYGAGHHQVSNAIKDKINLIHPAWDVQIYDFFSIIDPNFSKILSKMYMNIIKYMPIAYKVYYDSTHNIDPFSRWHTSYVKPLCTRTYEFINEISPEVIVCTFPTPARIISLLKAEKKTNIPLITVITDISSHSQWIHPMVDKYIVPTDTVASGLIKKGIQPNRIHAVGIPLRYQFERKNHIPPINVFDGYNPNAFTILIMGGGTGLLKNMESICLQLGSLEYPLQVIVVTGKNKGLADKLKKMAHFLRNPIHVFGFVDNIASIMDVADIIITKPGGVTIFEALAKNLPIILTDPLPGQEMINARYLLHRGAALIANKDSEVISIVKDLYMNKHKLDKMIKSAKSLSKPNATREAVDIIINSAVKFRKEKHKCSLNVY